jgi:HEAT repeat protein
MNSPRNAVSALTATLHGKDGIARQAARDRLVGLGRSVTRALCGLLEDTEPQVRWEAVMALREIADPTSVPALMEALLDADQDVRWVAAEALGRTGRPGLQAVLDRLVEDPGSPEFRTAFRVAASHTVDPVLRNLLEPVRESLVRDKPTDAVIVAAGGARAALAG